MPILAILAFPLWVLWRSGELMSDDAIVTRMLSNQPVQVGLAFSDPTVYVNRQVVLAKKPEVLVLGSSRVDAMRASLFKPGTNVFIAGTTVQAMGQFREFLDQIPATSSPKILIIGLDQKFFNPALDTSLPDGFTTLLTQPEPTLDAFARWPMVYWFYLQKKFSLADIIHPSSTLIGLSAIEYDAGYRNDGSYDRGTGIGSQQDTLSLIEHNSAEFQHSNTISQSDLAELDAFLAECQTRHITVIGFIPPFSPTVTAKLATMPGDYGYLAQIPADTSAIFKKYQFTFYDFGDPATLGITDAEVPDGVHTNDLGSLIMFNAMALSDPTLSAIANPKNWGQNWK